MDCNICGKKNVERYHFQKNHNPSKSKEVLRKISEKAKLRYQNPNYAKKMKDIWTPVRRQLLSQKTKERYKHRTVQQEQIRKEKLRRAAIQQWERGNKGYHPNRILAQNRRKGWRTRAEKIMKKGLDNKGIKYQEEVRIGKYFPDFLVNENIVIECDSKYWHPKNNLYDKKRDKYMTTNGYKVLRFLNSEIKNNLSTCLDEIEKVILKTQHQDNK